VKIKTKHIIVFIVLASVTAIIYGFNIQQKDPVLANKCIGFGTVGLFLIAMPMFLFKESKGKKMKDYMLTDENIRKMQGKKPEKPENQ
jgi:cyanate permease